MSLRAVLDTNVIVSGFGWGGLPSQVLDAAFDGRFVVVTSVALLDELAVVIRRGQFSTRFPDPDRFVGQLRRMALVTNPEPTASVLDDSDDNRLVEAAQAASAEFIVTGDQLVLDADPIGATRVVPPREFLALLDQFAS